MFRRQIAMISESWTSMTVCRSICLSIRKLIITSSKVIFSLINDLDKIHTTRWVPMLLWPVPPLILECDTYEEVRLMSLYLRLLVVVVSCCHQANNIIHIFCTMTEQMKCTANTAVNSFKQSIGWIRRLNHPALLFGRRSQHWSQHYHMSISPPFEGPKIDVYFKRISFYAR